MLCLRAGNWSSPSVRPSIDPDRPMVEPTELHAGSFGATLIPHFLVQAYQSIRIRSARTSRERA